jgi:hypothetical protein
MHALRSSFGVCCLFTTSTAGATVSENCTYVQNPNFPSPYMETSAVSYTVNKVSGNVALRRGSISFSLHFSFQTISAS